MHEHFALSLTGILNGLSIILLLMVIKSLTKRVAELEKRL